MSTGAKRVMKRNTRGCCKAAESPEEKEATDPATGARTQLWEKSIELSRTGGTILSLALSPKGNKVLTGEGDGRVRLWDLKSGGRIFSFKGHTMPVDSVAISPNGKLGLSGSDDRTVRLWDLESGHSLRVLEGHTAGLFGVTFSPDGKRALSCSEAVRLWDLKTWEAEQLLWTFRTEPVASVAFSPDGERALFGEILGRVRLWDIESGRSLLSLEGHRGMVWSLAFSRDGKRALSGGTDNTVRLWDLDTGRALRVFERHTDSVRCVAFSPYAQRALSGSADKTVRVWDLENDQSPQHMEGHSGAVLKAVFTGDGKHVLSGDGRGVLHSWKLAESALASVAFHGQANPAAGQIQYTNAKVLLMGDGGSGKTGLTERLVHNRPPRRGPSTAGTWSTQWPLEDLPQELGSEREVWLWDFGGQADQRLIHQLYLDHTALVLLMFDSDKDSVTAGLREWQQALARSVARSVPTLLVAGRTDVGLRFDREKVDAFAHDNKYEFFETSAETGSGIPELRKAMLEKIPWQELTRHNSPALFKRLKDEILKLRDEGRALMTLKELESTLRLRLPADVSFADAHLETVVSLLDGPGLVKELGFGTYILLRPEWINIYAQAVIRTLRAPEYSLGSLPVSSIAEGKLIFQTKQADGNETEEKRLPKAEEEVVLQAMEQLLVERRLCLRQNGDLVFPSHCGLERPVGPMPPHFFVSYTISGFLDDIYATLVVKLAHCGAFKLKEVWRDAADFETLDEAKIVGIKLVRREDGRGELLAHAKGVSQPEQVIFATYIHEHLKEKSTEEVPRLRFYSCPRDDEPIENRKLAMEILERDGESAQIRCQRCDKFVALWDALEKRFASETIKQKVEFLRQQEQTELATRQQGKLLVLEVSARITSANQKCWEIPGDQDEGIDLDVEFTDDDGNGTGKHMYLQLKAGNSFLRKRKKDGAEIFTIKKQRWVQYWINQSGPMMLVIGTFLEDRERGFATEKNAFANVRWMEIGELLKKESDDGKKPVKQIEFIGERLDALSVRKWRKAMLERD